MNQKNKIKILARAIFELRILLSGHLHEKTSVGRASSLAYLLHNEALSILEDRENDFDIDGILKKLENLDKMYDEDGYLKNIFEEVITPENKIIEKS